MQVLPNRGGWIEVVCGPMFGGKSEELMRRLRRAQIARQSVAVFKPALDNRYHDTDVVSHDGTRLASTPVTTSHDILQLVGDAEVIGIDEGQFFDEGIIDVCMKLADDGRRVVVAALDQDFKNDPFGPMPTLLAISEFVTKLQAICQSCGGPGTRTQRLIDGRPAHRDEPVIKVGAAESYEPRCRACHQVPDDRPAFGLGETTIREVPAVLTADVTDVEAAPEAPAPAAALAAV